MKPNMFENYHLFVQDAALTKTARTLTPSVATREQNTFVAVTRMSSVLRASSVRATLVSKILDVTVMMEIVLDSMKPAPTLLLTTMTFVSGVMEKTVN